MQSFHPRLLHVLLGRAKLCALVPVAASLLGIGAMGCQSEGALSRSPNAPVGTGERMQSASGVVMPTPESITREEPGGDAPDKELAALTLLTEGKTGYRTDRWETLHVQMIDPKNWKRVRVFGQETRATFRYGDDTHALDVVIYEPSDGPSDPASCMQKFLHFADDTASAYSVDYQVSPIYDREQTVPGEGTDVETKKPMKVALVEAHVDNAFVKNDWVAAVAAYQSFPGTCLVQGFAAVSTNHVDAARRARDRWVSDAAPRLEWDAINVGDQAPSFDAR